MFTKLQNLNNKIPLKNVFLTKQKIQQLIKNLCHSKHFQCLYYCLCNNEETCIIQNNNFCEINRMRNKIIQLSKKITISRKYTGRTLSILYLE